MAGRVLISFFLMGQMFDVLSTFVAIRMFHFIEANPFAYQLFGTVGMLQVMMLKIAIAIGLIFLYLHFKKKAHRLHRSVETSLLVGSIGVWLAVFFNLFGMFLTIGR